MQQRHAALEASLRFRVARHREADAAHVLDVLLVSLLRRQAARGDERQGQSEWRSHRCLRDLAWHQCAMLTAGGQSVSLPSSPTRGLMRPMHDLLRLGLIALAAAASACVQRADVATEERVIRDLDKKRVQAVAARDTTAIANVYAEDADLLAAGAPRASGRAAIRQAWVGFLKTPKLVLTFEPTKITIASSADIAYESGSYHLGDDVATKAKRGQGEGVKSRRAGGPGKYVG